MIINVVKNDPHTYGTREVLTACEVTAIRAERGQGAGDARISYYALTADGWFSFRKGDNQQIAGKLPVIKDFPHKELTGVRSVRPVYKYRSDTYLLPEPEPERGGDWGELEAYGYGRR